MDEEEIYHSIRMREDRKHKSFEIGREGEVYRKALVDITNANTAGQMLAIAYRVLSENRK
jgi:hypothetical protein